MSCVSRPVTVTTQNASHCVDLIPDNLKDDVPGVPIPDNAVGPLGNALVGQTIRLDQANDEKKTIIGICDKHKQERVKAIEQIMKPWYQFW